MMKCVHIVSVYVAFVDVDADVRVNPTHRRIAIG